MKAFLLFLALLGLAIADCSSSITTLQASLDLCSAFSPSSFLTDPSLTFETAAALCTGSTVSSCSLPAVRAAFEASMSSCSGANATVLAALDVLGRNVSFSTSLICQFITETPCFKAAQTIYAAAQVSPFNASTCASGSGLCLDTLRVALASYMPFSPPADILNMKNALSQCIVSDGQLCATQLMKAVSDLKAANYSGALSALCGSQCLQRLHSMLPSQYAGLTQLPCVLDSTGVLCYKSVLSALSSFDISSCISSPTSCISSLTSLSSSLGNCLGVLPMLAQAFPSSDFSSLMSAIDSLSSSFSIPTLQLPIERINFTLVLDNINSQAVQLQWSTFESLLKLDLQAAVGLTFPNLTIVNLLPLQKRTSTTLSFFVSVGVLSSQYSQILAALQSNMPAVLSNINSVSTFLVSPMLPVSASGGLVYSPCSASLSALVTLSSSGCLLVAQGVLSPNPVNMTILEGFCNGPATQNCTAAQVTSVLVDVALNCPSLSSYIQTTAQAVFAVRVACDQINGTFCFEAARAFIAHTTADGLDPAYLPAVCGSPCTHHVIRAIYNWAPSFISTPSLVSLVGGLEIACLRDFEDNWCLNEFIKAKEYLSSFNLSGLIDIACHSRCLPRLYAVEQFLGLNISSFYPHCNTVNASSTELCYTKVAIAAETSGVFAACANSTTSTQCMTAGAEFYSSAGNCLIALGDFSETYIAKLKSLGMTIPPWPAQAMRVISVDITINDINVTAVLDTFNSFKALLLKDIAIYFGLNSLTNISINTPALVARTSSSTSITLTSQLSLPAVFGSLVEQSLSVYDGNFELLNVNSDYSYRNNATTAPSVGSASQSAPTPASPSTISQPSLASSTTSLVALIGLLTALLTLL